MMKKVAVVTGARRGIGLGIAKELGLAGCYVVMSAFSADAQDALEEMKALGLQDSCEYMQCDISDAPSREALLGAVCQKFGRLDILVNCAGVAPKSRLDLLETTEESYDLSLIHICIQNRGVRAQRKRNSHPLLFRPDFIQ